MITAEQFAEWKEHPVTKEIYERLSKVKQGLLEHIGDGNTLGNQADITHGVTNKAVGQIEGLNQLLNISFADEDNQNDVNEVSGY